MDRCTFMMDKCTFMTDRCTFMIDRCTFMIDRCTFMKDTCSFIMKRCTYDGEMHFYDGEMDFYGLQNRNCHSLPLQSFEDPGHFFLYYSNCMYSSERRKSYSPWSHPRCINHGLIFIFGWTLPLMSRALKSDVEGPWTTIKKELLCYWTRLNSTY